ncbi:hypothetical protein K1T35_23480 [Pseudonocardia sp. DSM 110487]|uniref:hypothetical protein n=1 Tax=Pseudonocardia sp. DSM 110487 TaxID=2865833 RepID=UPI001C6A4BF9|nr:hypothetical protein [Pseudonocardia sp. DSM 110487]QYN39887.1 hypothetical protein K1T35_23480 [Pseudonocardia sp. DSM 110487]
MTSAARRHETFAQRNFRLIGEAAEIITGWPQVRERLRAVHVPDSDGRCRGCTSQTRRAPEWPCALTLVAHGEEPRRDFTNPAPASHRARLV